MPGQKSIGGNDAGKAGEAFSSNRLALGGQTTALIVVEAWPLAYSITSCPLFGDEAVPAAEFKGNANEAVWLPNETVAKSWMEYVKTGATSDTTPPPPPFNVTDSSKGEQGIEITWDAEADFESGIQEFIVMRDGQELAQVPEKPIGKFGRPLFQSMTYHDTPSQPMPAMRYADISAQVGEKHTYSVITVNGVGLRSGPSIRMP